MNLCNLCSNLWIKYSWMETYPLVRLVIIRVPDFIWATKKPAEINRFDTGHGINSDWVSIKATNCTRRNKYNYTLQFFLNNLLSLISGYFVPEYLQRLHYPLRRSNWRVKCIKNIKLNITSIKIHLYFSLRLEQNLRYLGWNLRFINFNKLFHFSRR